MTKKTNKSLVKLQIANLRNEVAKTDRETATIFARLREHFDKLIVIYSDLSLPPTSDDDRQETEAFVQSTVARDGGPTQRFFNHWFRRQVWRLEDARQIREWSMTTSTAEYGAKLARDYLASGDLDGARKTIAETQISVGGDEERTAVERLGDEKHLAVHLHNFHLRFAWAMHLATLPRARADLLSAFARGFGWLRDAQYDIVLALEHQGGHKTEDVMDALHATYDAAEYDRTDARSMLALRARDRKFFQEALAQVPAATQLITEYDGALAAFTKTLDAQEDPLFPVARAAAESLIIGYTAKYGQTYPGLELDDASGNGKDTYIHLKAKADDVPEEDDIPAIVHRRSHKPDPGVTLAHHVRKLAEYFRADDYKIDGFVQRRRTVADRLIAEKSYRGRYWNEFTLNGASSAIGDDIVRIRAEAILCRADQSPDHERLNFGALCLAEGYFQRTDLSEKDQFLAVVRLHDMLTDDRERVLALSQDQRGEDELSIRMALFAERLRPGDPTEPLSAEQAFFVLGLLGDWPEIRPPLTLGQNNGLDFIIHTLSVESMRKPKHQAWLLESLSDSEKDAVLTAVDAAITQSDTDGKPVVLDKSWMSIAQTVYCNRFLAEASAAYGRKSYDLTLETYLKAMNVVRKAGISIAGPETSPAEMRRIRENWWALFRQARIFDIPVATVTRLIEASRVYVITKILGLKPSDVEPDTYAADVTLEQSNWLHQCAMAVSVPSKLPFEVCFFGFGAGVTDSRPDGGERSALLGILVTTHGHVANVVLKDKDGDQLTDTMAIELVHVPGSNDWAPHMVDEPWFLTALVDLLQDQRTFTLQEERSKGFNQAYKGSAAHATKDKNALPPPYYLVTMRRDFRLREAKEALDRTPRPRRPLSYRFDVRAHDRARIERGPLPMDEARRKILDRRGYTILVAGQPIPERIQEALFRRGEGPPAQDGWLAIKLSDVDQFVRGPESGEYVPSIRRATPRPGDPR